MVAALRRWLWKGTYDLPVKRLEIDDSGLVTGDASLDLKEQAAAHLAELGRMVDFAKELESQRSTTSDEELRSLCRLMLPVLDALDRVLDYAKEVEDGSEQFDNWVKSVEGISTRLNRVLEKIGLSPMNSLGMEVDFSMHDVVGTRVSRDHSENTVIEEQLKGYYFRGRLLRDAKVVVAVSTP